jgi:hypothetical protein
VALWTEIHVDHDDCELAERGSSWTSYPRRTTVQGAQVDGRAAGTRRVRLLWVGGQVGARNESVFDLGASMARVAAAAMLDNAAAAAPLDSADVRVARRAPSAPSPVPIPYPIFPSIPTPDRTAHRAECNDAAVIDASVLPV